MKTKLIYCSIFASMFILFGCVEITDDAAFSLVKARYSDAVFMSCAGCSNKGVISAKIFFRRPTGPGDTCEIYKANLNKQNMNLGESKLIGADSLESCIADHVYTENQELYKELRECHDVFQRIRDDSICYEDKE